MTDVESRNDDLATQLDQHSDYFRENVYEIYAELRKTCPMVHSEKWGGFWAFLDYEDVYDAEQVAEIFSSGAGKEVPGVPGSIPFIPIDYDPPLVQDYRKIALSFFSPGAAKALEPTFRRLATYQVHQPHGKWLAKLPPRLLATVRPGLPPEPPDCLTDGAAGALTGAGAPVPSGTISWTPTAR